MQVNAAQIVASNESQRIPAQSLYQTKPEAYASLLNQNERTGQRRFVAMFESGAVAPTWMGVFAGVPLIQRNGEWLRMFTPYYEELRKRLTRQTRH